LIAAPATLKEAGGPADVVLMLGARVGMNTGSSGGREPLIPADATLIQVDIEPEEIGRAREVELGLVGDIKATLELMIERSRGRTFKDHRRWLDGLTAAQEAQRHLHDEAMARPDPPIHQAKLTSEIAGFLNPDAIIVADGGETSGWMGQQATVESAGSWLSHGYLGCLGVGIPFGLAAQLAHPDRQVLTIIGDGSVGLNLSEFDTAVRHNLPLVVVINNDQGWGMSRHLQIAAYGKDRTVAVELGPVRYDLAAAAFGAHAELVERPEDIRPALERAFASGKPACINVMTDPTLPIADYSAVRGRLEEPEEEGKGKDVNLPYYGRRKLGAKP
jgi:acetolactate synthase-1/2/3 large subunit